jgi:hypothetical protein
MKKMVELTAVVPKNLVLEDIIDVNKDYDYLVNCDGTKRNDTKKGSLYLKMIDEMYYFISKIISTNEDSYSSKVYGKTKYKYVELSNLQITYNKANQIIHFLKNEGVIKRGGLRGGYGKNSKLYFFKLTDKYINEDCRLVKIKMKPKTRLSLKPIDIESDFVYNNIINDVKRIKFPIDYVSNLIDEYVKSGIIPINNSFKYFETIYNAQHNILLVKLGNNVDRIYTTHNLTPKIIRKYYGLIEIDFTNFNCHILSKIINVDGDEMNRFKKAVDSDFYLHVVDIFKRRGINIDRETAKEITIYKWINARIDNRFSEYNIMCEEFPLISKKIYEMKGINEFTYKQFSWKFMNLEAKLIYEILNEFKTDYPNSICLPIFDSIAVNESNVDNLISVMNKHSKQLLGYELPYKIKSGDEIKEIKL